MTIIQTNVQLTPKQVAEAFWSLDNIQQAQFFEELHDLLEGRPYPEHLLGETQWMYMSDEIEKRPKAKRMACVLASHIFIKATNYMEHNLPFM